MSRLVLHGYEISGTEAAKPSLAVVETGLTRYNETTGRLEVWNGTAWTYPSGEAVSGSVGVAAGTGVTASEQSGLRKTVLTLTNLSVTMTDATTSGCHGTQKLYDFPAGNILFLGATCDLTILAGSGGIGDTASAVVGVGTAAVGTNNATLAGTEQDLIPSTAATLTAGLGSAKGKSLTAGVAVFDGTGTAIDAILNIAVPDANSSANDTFTVNGTVTLTWVNLGDN